MRKVILILLVLCCISALLVPVKSFAGIEPYTNRLKGPFGNGHNKLYLKDKKFLNPLFNWSEITNNSVKNAVTLRVLDSALINYAFKYTVNLSIKKYTSPDTITNAPTIVTTSLTVNYDPASHTTYKSIDNFTFTGAYKLEVTVTSVNDHGMVPLTDSVIALSAHIIIDRTSTFYPTARLYPTYIPNADSIHLEAFFHHTGAEEYDIEWTTINSGNPYFAAVNSQQAGGTVDSASFNATLEKIFKNNSSRVTTDENRYNLSLISTDRFVLVRVRQVRYTADGIRETGDWDYKKVSGYAIWSVAWHESKLNWQYSSAFAEEGKKKEVISYFDGSLRGKAFNRHQQGRYTA